MQVALEVAIGVVLTIATLAVVVSATMELISGLFRMRAHALEQGIARMLDNQVLEGRGWKGLFGVRKPVPETPATAELLKHPLVQALSAGRATDRPPSYIDAITFATAFLGSSFVDNSSLIEKFITDGDELGQDVTKALAASNDAQFKKVLTDAWAGANNSAHNLVTALIAGGSDGLNGLAALIGQLVGDATAIKKRIDVLAANGDPAAAPLAAAWQASGNDLRHFVDLLQRQPALLTETAADANAVEDGIKKITVSFPAMGKSLEALWQTADRDFTNFRHEIEDWFDREMQRVSGWYSRWSQWIMLVVAFGLTVALNISVVTVAKALWFDPTLRAEAVAVAQSETSTTTTAPAATTAGTAPAASVTARALAASVAAAQTPATTTTTAAPQTSTTQSVEQIGLPIGWSKVAWPGESPYLLLHILGWIIAAIAASFGAPFWFDILGKLVNFRIGGTPPTTAADQRKAASTT
jgi:hypothetical protein